MRFLTFNIFSTKGVWLGSAQQFVDKTRRRAYSMLEAGIDTKRIAVDTYRDVAWVEDLKREFGF